MEDERARPDDVDLLLEYDSLVFVQDRSLAGTRPSTSPASYILEVTMYINLQFATSAL